MAHHTFNPRLPALSRPDGVVLVDRAELGRRRWRLADGSAAVGQYWSGYQWVPVFRLADCVPLAPLSVKQQASWDATRRCVRCGEVAVDPWPKYSRPAGTPGRPMCMLCPRVEDQVHEAARANAARTAAVAYADALIADPTLAVILEEPLPYLPGVHVVPGFRVVAVDGAGAVLLDATVQAPAGPLGPGSVVRPGVPVAEVADRARALAGRRLVSWHPWDVRRLKEAMLRDLGEVLAVDVDPASVNVVTFATTSTLGPTVHFGGDVAKLYAKWHGLERVDLAAQGDLLDVARSLLALVGMIAADEHPAGPARCPQRPGREETACAATPVGVDGMCAVHTAAAVDGPVSS